MDEFDFYDKFEYDWFQSKLLTFGILTARNKEPFPILLLLKVSTLDEVYFHGALFHIESVWIQSLKQSFKL